MFCILPLYEFLKPGDILHGGVVADEASYPVSLSESSEEEKLSPLSTLIESPTNG